MPPAGIEPTTSAGERPQTHALGRAATGTGMGSIRVIKSRGSVMCESSGVRSGPRGHEQYI